MIVLSYIEVLSKLERIDIFQVFWLGTCFSDFAYISNLWVKFGTTKLRIRIKITKYRNLRMHKIILQKIMILKNVKESFWKNMIFSSTELMFRNYRVFLSATLAFQLTDFLIREWSAVSIERCFLDCYDKHRSPGP